MLLFNLQVHDIQIRNNEQKTWETDEKNPNALIMQLIFISLDKKFEKIFLLCIESSLSFSTRKEEVA